MTAPPSPDEIIREYQEVFERRWGKRAPSVKHEKSLFVLGSPWQGHAMRRSEILTAIRNFKRQIARGAFVP